VPHPPITRQSQRIDFTRASWIRRLWALDACLSVGAAILLWFQFILPLLPQTRWIRYALTPVGLIFLYCIAEILITNLFSNPIERAIKDEREGVVGQVESTGKR
jgi:hypothetical protein